jgi:hypothetical protein
MKKEISYQKLSCCAEQTDRGGPQYLWIDACCTDRWDNNERSKAINSMFRWYQNAGRRSGRAIGSLKVERSQSWLRV